MNRRHDDRASFVTVMGRLTILLALALVILTTYYVGGLPMQKSEKQQALETAEKLKKGFTEVLGDGVEIHTFPPGTTWEEIDQYLEEGGYNE